MNNGVNDESSSMKENMVWGYRCLPITSSKSLKMRSMRFTIQLFYGLRATISEFGCLVLISWFHLCSLVKIMEVNHKFVGINHHLCVNKLGNTNKCF